MYFRPLFNSERTQVSSESVQPTEHSFRTAERLSPIGHSSGSPAVDLRHQPTAPAFPPQLLIYVAETDKMATEQSSVFTSVGEEEGTGGRAEREGGARRLLTFVHVVVGHDGDALLPHHADVSPVAVAGPEEHG